MFKNKERIMSDELNPDLKKAVVSRLAGLDRDRLLSLVESLQMTVLGQAVQLSELQTKNAKQIHEINGFEISLEETLALLSRINETHISRVDIAKFVLRSIHTGELPIPEYIAREKDISFVCQGEDVDFDEVGGVSCSVLATNTGYDPLIYRLAIIPDSPTDIDYPHFHFGYTKPTPVKRVRKPKAKPAEGKK
jgi:hypothetical protein